MCIRMRLHACVCARARARVWECIYIVCACSFTVHRNEMRLQVLILNTCAFLFFVLYVYECTFVPKNLDRVRGHRDINSFFRASAMCVSAQHSVCKVCKFIS